MLIAIEDNRKAEKRHRAAIKKLREDRNRQSMEDNKQIVARFVTSRSDQLVKQEYFSNISRPYIHILKKVFEL